ncbi:hypothetical protein D3C80_1613550 [compost metagenome]
MRALAAAKQRQRRLYTVAGAEQVGANHSLHQLSVEVPRLKVFAGAGIEDHQIQGTPRAFDMPADLCDLLPFVDIACYKQNLAGKARGQCLQRRNLAGTQGQLMTLFEQDFRQRRAYAAAAASQPDAAHASLRLSQAISRPIKGRCW